jgi:hypothetical protein
MRCFEMPSTRLQRQAHAVLMTRDGNKLCSTGAKDRGVGGPRDGLGSARMRHRQFPLAGRLRGLRIAETGPSGAARRDHDSRCAYPAAKKHCEP